MTDPITELQEIEIDPQYVISRDLRDHIVSDARAGYSTDRTLGALMGEVLVAVMHLELLVREGGNTV